MNQFYTLKKTLSKKHIILIIITLSSSLSKAQLIQDYMTLDTVIFLKDLPVKGINPFMNSAIASNQTRWFLHTFNRTKKDTFYFTSLDKQTKTYLHHAVFAPDLKKAIYETHVYAFAASKDWLVISYHLQLALFKIHYKNDQIESLSFYKTVDVPDTYSYLYLNEKQELIGAKSYNSYDPKHNFVIASYSLDSSGLTLQHSFIPDFENIEFSVFSPHHWISASSEYIAVSQTTDYKIDFYDRKGNSLFSFSANKSGWITMEAAKMKELRAKIPKFNAGAMIDSLDDYNDHHISRIEGIWFVNEDMLAVGYYHSEDKSKFPTRYFDLYRIENNKATLIVANLKDGWTKDKETILTKTNYDVLMLNSTSEIASGELLKAKNFAPIPYLNRPLGELRKDEEFYYKDNEPVVSLFLYKIK